jgi:hypothetical protein
MAFSFGWFHFREWEAKGDCRSESYHKKYLGLLKDHIHLLCA